MEEEKLLTKMVNSYKISSEATVDLINVNKELIKNLILELKKKIESEIEIDDSSLKGELEKNNLDLNDRYKNILSTLHSVKIKTNSVDSIVSTLITEKVLRPIEIWKNFFTEIVKDDNFSKLIADEISKKLFKKLSNEFSNKSNESKKAVHKEEEKAEFICDDFTKIKLKDKYGNEECVDMEEGADFCEKNGMDFINTPPTLPFCGKRGMKYFGGKKRRKSKRKKRRKTKRRKRNRKKSTRRRKRKSKRKKRRSKRRRKK